MKKENDTKTMAGADFENLLSTAVDAVDIRVASHATALKQVVEIYETLPGAFSAEPNIIANRILEFSQRIVGMHNAMLDKSEAALKWPMPKSILPFQMALCIMKSHHAVNISYVEDATESDIAVYCEEGIMKGLYTTDMDIINGVIYSYDCDYNKKSVDEVISRLKSWAPRKTRCSDRDLIPVNNGIFNYKTKKLLDFDPSMVFLAKSGTDYNENAKNVVIANPDGTTWDVESWMDELTDDPEITNLLWQVTGALLRPNVAWEKSAWLYSDLGENGKGTLCKMWRNLCGNAATSIPLSDFSKDFMLSSLITSQAIIVDENDVGGFIERAGALKAVITNDVVYINRKFKNPIHYQFHGMMVQCLNEMPRFKDKSDSIYRRQLFVPMNKCFTGSANPLIKSDYINRKEVLEYVMMRVLNMNYYSLSEPAACKSVLDEYKVYNDPVRQFWGEFEDRFVWDLVPYSFLWSLFKEWFRRGNPSGAIMGKNTFLKDLKNVVRTSDIFMVPASNNKIRTAGKMDKTEELIAVYNIVEWQSPGVTGKVTTLDKLCHPNLAESYRGLVRVANSNTTPAEPEKTVDTDEYTYGVSENCSYDKNVNEEISYHMDHVMNRNVDNIVDKYVDNIVNNTSENVKGANNMTEQEMKEEIERLQKTVDELQKSNDAMTIKLNLIHFMMEKVGNDGIRFLSWLIDQKKGEDDALDMTMQQMTDNYEAASGNKIGLGTTGRHMQNMIKWGLIAKNGWKRYRFTIDADRFR